MLVGFGSFLADPWTMRKPRRRRLRTASGVRIRGCIQRCDLALDVILECLNREVGQGDGRVTVLPGTLLGPLVRERLHGEEGGQALLLDLAAVSDVDACTSDYR